jgi:imidazolonepropionase-like amidohydrolase
MTTTVLTNAQIVDGAAPEPGAPTRVVEEDGLIREVSATATVPDDARAIDLRGRALMPGLIDAHVHVVAVVAGLGQNAALPDSLVAARMKGGEVAKHAAW